MAQLNMASLLWLGDPLRGIVVCGSAGLVTWSLIAALLGSLLGILRELDSHSPERPVAPAPPRERLRRAFHHRPATAAA